MHTYGAGVTYNQTTDTFGKDLNNERIPKPNKTASLVIQIRRTNAKRIPRATPFQRPDDVLTSSSPHPSRAYHTRVIDGKGPVRRESRRRLRVSIITAHRRHCKCIRSLIIYRPVRTTTSTCATRRQPRTSTGTRRGVIWREWGIYRR